MKTLLKYLLGTLAGTLLFVICLLLYVLLGNLSVHRDRILAAASDATGFEIRSDSPFNLEIGREISLSATEVVVANPGWPDGPAVASAGELRAVVDTWSLVSGPIRVYNVELRSAEINLIEDLDGRTNWIVPAQDSSGSVDEPAGPDPIAQKIVLDDVRISHQVEGTSGTRVEAQVLHLDRTGPNQYDLEIDVIFDQDEISNSLRTTGSIQFGDNLASLTHARVDFDSAELESKGAVQTSFSGFAAVDISAEKPVVDVAIEVSSLEVQTDADATADQDDENNDGAEFLFSTDPLVYSWLNTLELDADIKITEATVAENTMSNIHVVAAISDGILKVSPVEFEVGDGNVSASLELLPSDGQYKLSLTADVEDLRLAQLAEEDQDPASVPPLSAKFNLVGNGASIHDIMASSNGRFSGRHDGGQLKLDAVNALFSDFLTSILRTLNPLAEEQTYTNLECGIYEIEIAEGVADIKEMVIQSERLTIVSSGNVDLDTEELDLVMHTKTREGLGISVGGVSNSFVKLGGTLKEPALNVDAAGTVTTAGAAVATGGLSVLAKSLWDRLSGEVDLCRAD